MARLGEAGRKITPARSRVVAATLRRRLPFSAEEVVREVARSGVGRRCLHDSPRVALPGAAGATVAATCLGGLVAAGRGRGGVMAAPGGAGPRAGSSFSHPALGTEKKVEERNPTHQNHCPPV